VGGEGGSCSVPAAVYGGYGMGAPLPVDDFLASFGARGDRDRASRIARRAGLARETRQLRELCYDGLRCCVPGVKLLLLALLTLLRLPVTVPALVLRVGSRLGRHLVLTLVVFAALALLAAYVGMVLAEHETAAAHAPVHRPPGGSCSERAGFEPRSHVCIGRGRLSNGSADRRIASAAESARCLGCCEQASSHD
jgi:hypothetical protein